ncbi:MAG: endonuclease MutS2 [Treponema sp.]|nr:endonuclease MutS2 [Treponema sp.]MCL2251710.1 endonuclease MutS2 [Treponema sp.]
MTIDNQKQLMLTAKTETLLEYPKIMENVSSYAVSEEAAEIIKNSQPVYNKSCEETKEIVSTIYLLLKTRADEPRSWLPSINFLIPKIETEGTVLDIDETLAIGLFIERASEIKKWIKNEREEPETKGKILLLAMLEDETCPNCAPVSKEIFKIIDKEGNLRDLPVLRAIKKRISSLEKDLKSTVTKYTSDDEYKRMLQSQLPSQRDGRVVIAVKANFRNRIKGIVHELSSSGQTIYVEPLDVVEKNNEILIEKRNLDAEVQKLLRELTEKISIHAEKINKLHQTIIQLECLRAKAKYSFITKGYFALSSGENEKLILIQARHPMLKKAVPINLTMNSNVRTLIITGPNTGGKTVALKTLGLLAMMNQSGLALPVNEGSILPVFDGIYADIGDEQSINQSLSTFSAHITNISAITEYATENSLVLLDELGSGTDPQEGGAIAMAVLDFLIEKKSRMIVTTHHGILKNYGYTRAGVENASVEFNAQTLSPTYKIINGIPGESRALDIAEANGLDKLIVANARKYIDDEKTDVSEMIKGLEQKQRELAGLEKKSAIEQSKLLEEKRKSDLKELQLRQKEAELKRDSVGKLQQFLRESRKTLENLVRELKEGEVDREKTLKVKEFLNELARNAEEESTLLAEEEQALREHLQKKEGNTLFYELTAGMEVLAGSSKQRGTIIRVDKKNASGISWFVKIGSLKISFPQNELIPVLLTNSAAQSKSEQTSKVSWTAEYGSLENSKGAVFELKLLGMRLDEATEALRRQIEAATLSGLKNFSVIHGKGSGILQKGIHDFLKSDSAVADYYFSRPELGGFGRTEVVLK